MSDLQVNGCTLCDEIRDETANLFHDVIGNKVGIKSRILFQDENWIVIPAIGAFTLGYLLIISRAHFLSIAELKNKLYSSFEQLLSKIGIILNKQFGGSYIAFEHGTITPEYRLSCCVDHMHLHIIPFAKNCWQDIVQKYNFAYSEIAVFSDIKSYVKTNNVKSYLLFQNVDQRRYVIDSSKNIFPSQFFRQVISKEINTELKWDWRHYFYEDNILKTIEMSRNNHWFE